MFRRFVAKSPDANEEGSWSKTINVWKCLRDFTLVLQTKDRKNSVGVLIKGDKGKPLYVKVAGYVVKFVPKIGWS